MKKTLIALACLGALSGCAIVINPNGDIETQTVLGNTVAGNGDVRSENRTFAGAPRLIVDGSIQVDEQIGNEPSIQIETDSNLLPKVITESNGDTLHVYLPGSYRASHGVKVRVVTPAATAARLNGSGKITVNGIDSNYFDTNVAGSGDIRLQGRVGRLEARVAGSGTVDAAALVSAEGNAAIAGSGVVDFGRVQGATLKAHINGSGRIRGNGQVASLTAMINGSGKIDLGALVADHADIEVNGSGDVYASVTNAISAGMYGSGSINIYGKPAERNVRGRNVHFNG
ncbi:DUF2807 domain-containing protein [Burkholderiaceae bacterium DAT-1]|nr:DUF2807 domain-containing protein [Burkholderiaceae bacterium DAT-1]